MDNQVLGHCPLEPGIRFVKKRYVIAALLAWQEKQYMPVVRCLSTKSREIQLVGKQDLQLLEDQESGSAQLIVEQFLQFLAQPTLHGVRAARFIANKLP